MALKHFWSIQDGPLITGASRGPRATFREVTFSGPEVPRFSRLELGTSVYRPFWRDGLGDGRIPKYTKVYMVKHTRNEGFCWYTLGDAVSNFLGSGTPVYAQRWFLAPVYFRIPHPQGGGCMHAYFRCWQAGRVPASIQNRICSGVFWERQCSRQLLS